MKSIIFVAITVLSANISLADTPRDLKKHPLTKNEAKAYRASKSFAKEVGETISRRCVNASFDQPTSKEETSITIQFENVDVEGRAYCGDPHYSIGVEINSEGQVSNISLNDI